MEDLKLTRDLGWRKVEVYVDSKTTVKAIEDGGDKDMEGYDLIKQIHNFMKWFEEVRVDHTYIKLILVLVL